MGTKQDIEAAIQVEADGSGDLDLRVALGLPDQSILVRGETLLTGQAYQDPGFLDALLTALAAQFDTTVAGDVSGLRVANQRNDEATTLVAGEVVRTSSVGAVLRAIATGVAGVRSLLGFVPVAVGAGQLGTVRTAGTVAARFVAGLVLAAGEPVFVSTTGGYLTNTTAGLPVIYQVGFVMDPSAYAPATPIATILIRPGVPVVV